ncbi:hypothetical protein SUNI508_11199 [Seiridium unicorne]|uniref:S-adenosyl-L-methionine-dependent methyltransferase n=1 Tax=Seiridium unicorne TaxID=138068 RepID=A0ABR2UJ31_9PEZI
MAQQAQSTSSPSNKQHDEVELNPRDIAHSPKHLDQDRSVVSTNQTTPIGQDAPSSHFMESTRVFEDAPLMPSELIESYETATAPTQLYAEDSSFTTQTPLDYDASLFPHRPSNPPDPNFAIVANDMINKALGRTPGGNSVIEPDSVLGESGRLYHGYNAGKYFLPNDAAEQDRLDLQHKLFEVLFDGWLALAPLPNAPRYVLDIGCGTGLWATDFAEQNPSSFVVGSDLSAIQPQASVPNCIFVKDDAESPWYFPEPNPDHTECQGACDHFISFDYVHLRMMFSCFEDTRNVLRNAYDNMIPGGWIEFQDSSFDVRQGNPDFEGNALIRYGQACIRGAAVKGRDILKSEKYEEWLEETGFVDIKVRKFLFPCNPWPDHEKLKEVGRFNIVNLVEGLKGIGWQMLTASGMTPAEVDTLIEDINHEVKGRRNHSYSYIWVVYGRKPLPKEVLNHSTLDEIKVEGPE